MYSSHALLFFCAFVASILTIGNSLECMTCNATFENARQDDACKSNEISTTCTNPAVCLSAVLLYEGGKQNYYTAVKSCHMPQNGQECENFLKNIQTLNPLSKVSIYDKKCSVCDKEKCNSYSTASVTFVPTLMAFIVSYVLCKLI